MRASARKPAHRHTSTHQLGNRFPPRSRTASNEQPRPFPTGVLPWLFARDLMTLLRADGEAEHLRGSGGGSCGPRHVAEPAAAVFQAGRGDAVESAEPLLQSTAVRATFRMCQAPPACTPEESPPDGAPARGPRRPDRRRHRCRCRSQRDGNSGSARPSRKSCGCRAARRRSARSRATSTGICSLDNPRFTVQPSWRHAQALGPVNTTDARCVAGANASSKAQTGAGSRTRRASVRASRATRIGAFTQATRREWPYRRAWRRCPPCPDVQSGRRRPSCPARRYGHSHWHP